MAEPHVPTEMFEDHNGVTRIVRQRSLTMPLPDPQALAEAVERMALFIREVAPGDNGLTYDDHETLGALARCLRQPGTRIRHTVAGKPVDPVLVIPLDHWDQGA